MNYVMHFCRNKKCNNGCIDKDLTNAKSTPPDWKYCKDCAEKLGIKPQHGVYFASSGPSYETPAEIKMARIMGADAVGMSTVPEAIVANYCGINVLGISCISNAAAGVKGGQSLSHEEVIETTNSAKASFKALLQAIIYAF